jgi:hypothetical protein
MPEVRRRARAPAIPSYRESLHTTPRRFDAAVGRALCPCLPCFPPGLYSRVARSPRASLLAP